LLTGCLVPSPPARSTQPMSALAIGQARRPVPPKQLKDMEQAATWVSLAPEDLDLVGLKLGSSTYVVELREGTREVLGWMAQASRGDRWGRWGGWNCAWEGVAALVSRCQASAAACMACVSKFWSCCVTALAVCGPEGILLHST
jgi:hypothetical protein